VKFLLMAFTADSSLMELHQLRYFCAVADTGLSPVPRKNATSRSPRSHSKSSSSNPNSAAACSIASAAPSASRTWAKRFSLAPALSPRTLQRQRRAHRAPAIGSRASRYRRHPHHRPLLARFAPRHLLPQISQSPISPSPKRSRRFFSNASAPVPWTLPFWPFRSAAMNSIPTRFSPSASMPRCPKLTSSPGAPPCKLADLRRDPFLFLRDGHCFRDTAVAACESRPPRSPRRLRKRPPFQPPGPWSAPAWASPSSPKWRSTNPGPAARPHRGHPSRTRHRRRSATRPHAKPGSRALLAPPRLTPNQICGHALCSAAFRGGRLFGLKNKNVGAAPCAFRVPVFPPM